MKLKKQMGKGVQGLEKSDGVHQTEKMELRHAPVKGYPAAFYTAVAVAVIYLGIIFFRALQG